MKFLLYPALILTLIACQTKKEEPSAEVVKTPFYVGTYTDGNSKGIYKYALGENGKLSKIGLAATSDNPSFLTISKDKKYLIAVNEISNEDTVGTVSSFLIKGDTLESLSTVSSGGAHPCHISINAQNYITTANYTGGNVGLLLLNQNGILSSLLDVQHHSGKGSTDRQEGPHAHSSWFIPDSNEVISVDLGTNELWFSTLDIDTKKLLPSSQQKLKMNDGAGPRHLTIHPKHKWLYVLNELDGTITLVKKNADGIYEKGTTISTLPADYSESNSSADIHISNDGNFVYASNRGHNSIAIFKTNPINGELTVLDHESTRGDAPRNFSLSPDKKFILVANQNTNNIISFMRNSETGLLNYVDEIEAPKPVCILFQ